jgi:hypothetical protein
MRIKGNVFDFNDLEKELSMFKDPNKYLLDFLNL